ncbi:hypothetical protein Ga0074812_103332 [Parafrankia irregularis]|uniref:Uncharacterized protein n=1 Tax=Parafrankia irregularis TaxID=795642 RepID=A0A0S4QJY4_9ACTN|nr:MULTISPECIES: hypothetical protein [Parafrankia]CUU54842.1 hypothetical protein Ga0074812_103332 [Parafrankia irregularis]
MWVDHLALWRPRTGLATICTVVDRALARFGGACIAVAGTQDA